MPTDEVSISPHAVTWRCPPRCTAALWAAFTALGIWYLAGAFPFGGPHGDAIREAVGVEHIARYGWDGPLLTHNFTGCPGVAITLVWLRRLTGVDPLSLLCSLSLVSGLVYWLASAGLIHRLTGAPVPLAGIVLLLSPVGLMAGMYPNDMVTAAAWISLALFLLAGAGRTAALISAALCLALAGWFRADAILITPAIPLLLYHGDRRRAFRRTLLVGAIAAPLALAAVYASGSSLSAIVRHAEDVTGEGGRAAQVAGFYVSFFPLLLVYLLVLGAVRLVRTHAWRLLGVVLLGTLPLWAVMANFPYPKYFTYVVPWFALAAVCGLEALCQSPAPRFRQLHLAALVALFVGQYLLGVQITPRNKPWRAPPDPRGVVLAERRFARGPVEYAAVALGPGSFNPFGHVGAPMSGILFTPLVIHREQAASRAFLDDCVAYVRDHPAPDAVYISRTQDGLSAAMYGLVHNGFRCVEKTQFGPTPDSWRCRWEKHGRRVTHYRAYTHGYTLDYLAAEGVTTATYFGGTGIEEARMLEQVATAQLLVRRTALFTRTIYAVTLAPPAHADPPDATGP